MERHIALVPRFRGMAEVAYVMPQAALRPCPESGCPTLTRGGRCLDHQTKQREYDDARQTKQREYDARRPSPSRRGYTPRWYRAVRAWLAADPMRQFCADPRGIHGKRLVMGQETDHKIPHRGDHALFWDRTNWQRLCRKCHAFKTLQERE